MNIQFFLKTLLKHPLRSCYYHLPIPYRLKLKIFSIFIRGRAEIQQIPVNNSDPGRKKFSRKRKSSSELKRKTKKTLLIIDQNTPEPDRDAGSRTLLCLIKSYILIGWDVKYFSDNRFSEVKYIRLLQQLGVNVLHDSKDDVINFPQWIATKASLFDLFCISRPDIARYYIKLIRAHSSKKIIYYGHDLHFYRYQMQYEVTRNLIALLNAYQYRIIESKIWSQVDLIYYPSQEEASVVNTQLGKNKAQALIPYFYDRHIIPLPTTGHLIKRKDIIFVGGFKHTPNEDAAIWFVHHIFPLIHHQCPSIRLYLIGSFPSKKIRQLASNNVLLSNNITDEALANYYQTIRLAVIPLRFGAGIKHKVVEAMHYGIPVVTTQVGLQGLPLIESILPATNSIEAFAARTLNLLSDDSLWLQTSRNEVSYVKKYFSVDRMTDKLKSDIACL